MRRSLQNNGSESPPGPDRRPYVQRQAGQQAVSSTSSPRRPTGMYVAEAIPIKSSRPARPFPSGSPFNSNPSSGVSHAERLVRSAGIIPSSRKTDTVTDRLESRFQSPRGLSGEILERVIANTPSNMSPIVLNNNRRNNRDRDQGTTGAVGTTERVSTNIFSLTGNKGRRHPHGVGAIPPATGTVIRLRDREYPHHHHHQEDSPRRESSSRNPGFHASSFSSSRVESNSNTRSTRGDMNKLLGPGSTPKNPNGTGSTTTTTTTTINGSSSGNSNEGPRGEGNRLVVKRRRDGDLEDLEDNTPLGLISFFDGIRSSLGLEVMGMGKGKGVQNLNNFDEFHNKPGASSPGKGGSNSDSNTQNPSHPKVSRTPQDLNLNSSRLWKNFEHNSSNKNNNDMSRKNGQRNSRIGNKPPLATASERQRDIHERYGVDKPLKVSVVNTFGRHIGSYSRVTDEKNSNKTKHGSPSPHSRRNTTSITSSSSGSHSSHPNNTHANANITNTLSNTKLINRSGGIRTTLTPSTPTLSGSLGKGGTHLIEESRSDNPPLNPSSSNSSRKELTEIEMKENATTFTGLRISGKTKAPILPDPKAPVYPNSNNNSKNTTGSSSGGPGNPGSNNTSNSAKTGNNSQGFSANKNNVSFGPGDSHGHNMDDRTHYVGGAENGNANAGGSNSLENNMDSETEDEGDDEGNSNSDSLNNANHDGLVNPSVDDETQKKNLGTKCNKCKVLANSRNKYAQKIKSLQKNNINMECLIKQKRELVEQLQQQVKVLMRENQHLAKIVINTERSSNASSTSSSTPNLINLTNGKSSTGLGFLIPSKSSTSPIISINQTASEGNCQADPASEIVQRKTVSNPSFLSAIHSLNPHRKVAMSPEHLKEAEDKISSLTVTCGKLSDDLESTKSEHDKMQRFLGDLLYTLNGRGFETVKDAEGNLVDLNRCKGDCILEIKGRDQRDRQKAPVRRIGGNDYMFKAVIGSQEKMIQNLIAQLEAQQRDLLIGDKLSSCRINGKGEGSKAAVLESEILQLMTLLEATCQRFPDVFLALREQHKLDAENTGKANSPRILSSQDGIVQKILDRCEQLILIRYPNVDPSQDQTSYSPNNKSRSSESRSSSSRRHKDKGSSSSSSSRRHSHSDPYSKPSRRLRSSGGSGSEESKTRISSQAIIPSEFRESEDCPGRPSSGSGTLDNQNHPNQQHQHEETSHSSGQDGMQVGVGRGSPSRRHSYHTDVKSVGPTNGNNPRVSEPINVPPGLGSLDSYCKDGRYCPYCDIPFESHMSPADVQEHLEAHLFHCDD